MKSMLIQIDEETADALEQIAPSRSRKRSQFVRSAIQKALWELEEHRTAEAYRRLPDSEPAYFDPSVWETPRLSRRKRK